MRHFETIKTEETQDFHIVCSVSYEETHPRDSFDDSCHDIDEILRKIDNGIYQWFMVRVEAYKRGILLGSAYLGGCLYESYQDFLNDAYYEELVQEAIKDAKRNLEKLFETA